MTTRTTDLTDLRAELQALRQKVAPDIPAELIDRLVDAEASHPKPEDALRDVRQIVEAHLAAGEK